LNSLLFVDDEIRVLDGLRRMLRAKREVWDCHFASSVDEALVAIETTNFDVVVSDMNMPGKTGLDLLTAMRAEERTHFTPFLMLTGNGDSNLKRAVLEAGANDFLNKPFDFVELQTRLRNVIALKAFQDEIRDQNILLEHRVQSRTAALESSRREIILRLAKAAETRDTDTGNHIARVGLAAQLIAKYLGFDEAAQERILLTSPLHDVGKIGISDDILRKPGPLTPEERSKMQEHCRIGFEILTQNLQPMFKVFGALEDSSQDRNDLLEAAAKIARYHHERWDGTGYPDGVAGEDIPIEARIVAVADVYDALRSHRNYKRAFNPAETLAMIQEGSGTQFDPIVVDALVANYETIEAAVQGLREEPHEFLSAA